MSGANGPRGLGRELLYAQCWEDVDIARAALRIRPGASVVAIGAAGDNVLAMLQDDPASVLAVDVHAAQTALAELKIGAIGAIEDANAVRAFLGASPDSRRVATYEIIRSTLPVQASRHWDAHVAAIAGGVIHTGRFERYLARFRRSILRLVPGRTAVRELLGSPSLDAQRRVYRERWDTRSWRLLFRLFFSRRILERFGRDPAFFAQCEIRDLGSHYLARARHALTELPAQRNPYLTYMLTGSVGFGPAAPDYLRPEVQAVVRARLPRVAVSTATLDEVLRDLPSRSVDAFYLSDIFELATPVQHDETLAELARVGRRGARICYWNNLAARRRSDALADRITSHADEAAALYAQDRAFIYSAFVVESVRGAGS